MEKTNDKNRTKRKGMRKFAFFSFTLIFLLACKPISDLVNPTQNRSERQERQSQAPVNPFSTGNHEYLKEVVGMINQERVTGRNCGNEIFELTGELEWDNDLAKAALDHAADLTFHPGMRGHVGSDSSRVRDRILRHTDKFGLAAENVILGRLKPENTVNIFFNSPGHCRNMMNHRYTHIGAAQHYNPETGRTATVYKLANLQGQDVGPPRERKFVDTDNDGI